MAAHKQCSGLVSCIDFILQDKRTQIDKEFLAWLKECHEKHDKQILFAGFKCVKTRVDLPRHRQYPWSVFQRVEWDGRTYKEGQMVSFHFCCNLWQAIKI